MKNAKSRAAAAAVVLAMLQGIAIMPSTAAAAEESTAEETSINMGDLNEDGSINIFDLSLLKKMCTDSTSFSDNAKIAADVNGDGFVTAADAKLVQDYLIGKEVSFAAPIIPEPPAPTTLRYYAVDAEYDSTSWEENTNAGFEGEGYVNYNNAAGTYITWTVEVPADGNYRVDFRFANGTDANRITKINVNGSNENFYQNFEGTGAWTTWETNSIVLTLKAGTNTIKAEATTDNGGPNMDYIELTATDEEAVKPSVTERYYAIEAETHNGWTETSNAGFAGEGYFNYNNVIGGYVNWTVEVPEDGNYAVDFCFANGTDVNRPTKVIVNGDKTHGVYLDFNGTGAWTTWSKNTLVLPLKKGTNTIKAYATTANGGPNMDYIELTQTGASAVEMNKSTQGKRVEKLNRGVAAAYTGSGVLVTWRLLATDNENTTFDLWKNGQEKLGTFTMDDASNFLDTAGTATDTYTIDTYVNGECTEFAQASLNFTTRNGKAGNYGATGAYFDIKLDVPAGGTTPDGVAYTYTANDTSVGDIDGDGQYELFVKWDPSNSKDNANDGYTGSVIIDCYRLDGTKVWRVDLGKNIRAGAHYNSFMVYDFDGDGKAEMICKTADGTKDGQGNVVGDSSKDYRNSAGKILEGPEYLTLFDGATGKALHTIDYKPGRGTVGDWGDTWGNRVDRHTACVAYLDGNRASAIFTRGYYTRMAATAYNVENGKLVEVWAFDTGHNASAAGYSDGNHQSMGADVDMDGKDEVVLGSAVVDDNGQLLYTSGLGHGDALHIGDFDPSNPGVEIFMPHEHDPYGISLRDGETGKILFRETAGGDTGRALADNIIAGNDGAEMCGVHNGIIYETFGSHAQPTDADGNVITWANITKWGQNSVVYWTDTLERGVMDRAMIDQYGKGRVFTGDGASYNNYSKSNMCLTADICGDWREEIIARVGEDGTLRIFTTTYETEYPVYSLMHNPQYRVQVAAQNTGYNQPPHTDYFLGTGFDLPETPDVWTID